MNILVTGGGGYIGSTTAQTLLNDGHFVTVYDSLIHGHYDAVPKEAQFVQADLSDTLELLAVLTGQSFDAIVHFAAHIEAGESMQKPGKYFRNNFCASLGLIDAAVRANINRFVFSSTAAVYASSELPLQEDSTIQPTNVYGHTKRMTEQALEWYRQIYGLKFASLRYFNAAGATAERGEAHQPETHLIPLVLQVALGQRKSIHIYGNDYPTPDGTCIRDYIHISDLATAHCLALEALSHNDRLIFNLGNGAGYSVLEVIETARRVTGHAIPAEITPRRQGDASRLVASCDRIRHQLGWQPRVPDLTDIIASAWDWHHTHPYGYQKA